MAEKAAVTKAPCPCYWPREYPCSIHSKTEVEMTAPNVANPFTEKLLVKADVYVADPEGEDDAAVFSGKVEVERTDNDEVRLIVSSRSLDYAEVASVYLTDAAAARLAQMLGKVVLEA